MAAKTHKPIPINAMRAYLAVDPTSRTGLRWVKLTSNRGDMAVGAPAGTANVCSNGYYTIGFNYKRYLVARVVYALHYGVDPAELQVDHINLDKKDNRIENLRLVTSRQNSQNRPNHGAWPVGVYYNKVDRRYQAQIYIAGKRFNLGYFSTPEMASAAYQAKCAELETATEAGRAE